jgi:uncharacterized membrane protein YfcA
MKGVMKLTLVSIILFALGIAVIILNPPTTMSIIFGMALITIGILALAAIANFKMQAKPRRVVRRVKAKRTRRKVKKTAKKRKR